MSFICFCLCIAGGLNLGIGTENKWIIMKIQSYTSLSNPAISNPSYTSLNLHSVSLKAYMENKLCKGNVCEGEGAEIQRDYIYYFV